MFSLLFVKENFLADGLFSSTFLPKASALDNTKQIAHFYPPDAQENERPAEMKF